MRIKRLEVELNLSNLKRKEAEFQQTILTNSNIDKEAKIKDLKSEYESLEERHKQLLINQQCIEKSFSVSAINRRNNDKIAEDAFKKREIGVNCEIGEENERNVSIITMEGRSSFAEDTDLTAKGLKALEDENIKLQKKVKSLQCLMNETGSSSPNGGHLSSALREAQQIAENLLSNDSNQTSGDNDCGNTVNNNLSIAMTTPSLKRYSRSEATTIKDNGTSRSGGQPVKLTQATQATQASQVTPVTPSSSQAAGQTRYRTSSRTIQECTRTERTQITSTPISSTSIYRFQQHHQRSTSPKSHN